MMYVCLLTPSSTHPPPQRLQVLFAVGTDGEVSEPLEVNALDCDTVEQVKEKILLAFKTKFGFPYNTPLQQMHIGQFPYLMCPRH